MTVWRFQSEVLMFIRSIIARADEKRDAGEWRQARELYERAVNKNPKLDAIWVQLGHTCKESGDLDAAENAYRSALRVNSKVADTHLQLGHLLKIAKRPIEAAASYRQAIALDPGNVEAQRELDHLKQLGVYDVQPYSEEVETLELSSDPTHLVFDVSDLIQYYENARLPTGIQRVQIEIICNLIYNLPTDCAFSIACFSNRLEAWCEIRPLLFNHVARMSLVDGDVDAKEWVRAKEELGKELEATPAFVFPRGAYLINLGTSWWLRNYFLHLRAAKARYGIKYVPYVHDCIPVITPEHCTAGLTRDFTSWLLGAFQHADHFFANSRATARDVERVAKYLGHEIQSPAVVTLDGDYRSVIESLRNGISGLKSRDILTLHSLTKQDYVLFVSTIESRKNHVAAFSAWLTLLKKYGASRVPRLVCVGNRGWLNDAVYSKLDASEALRSKVLMLSRISDVDLENLYRNSLFTLYPSMYEGWGLPVTESLCYGKVPLLSNSSSLPEAGGAFAEYFDLGSEPSLVAKLERLIFDRDYLEQREQEIVANFKAKSWHEISHEIIHHVQRWRSDPSDNNEEQPASADGVWAVEAEPGRYYGLIENESTQIWPGMTSGEMFRQGDGWWWPEPWGCWTKPGVSTMAFYVRLPENDSIFVVGVRGIQRANCRVRVSIDGANIREINLAPEEDRWMIMRVSRDDLVRLRQADGRYLFVVRVFSDKYADFASFTDGVDHRTAAAGVRGFIIYPADDMNTRLRVIESIAADDLDILNPRNADSFHIPPL